MATTEEEHVERAELGRALRRAAELRGVGQNELADQFGTSQSMVSQWYHGKSPMSPSLVFALEEYLNLPGGWLSAHLGYLPLTGQQQTTPEMAVLDDEGFSEKDKAALLAMIEQIRDYRAALEAPAPAKRLASVKSPSKAAPRKPAAKPAKAPAAKKASVKKAAAKPAPKGGGTTRRARVSAVAGNGG